MEWLGSSGEGDGRQCGGGWGGSSESVLLTHQRRGRGEWQCGGPSIGLSSPFTPLTDGRVTPARPPPRPAPPLSTGAVLGLCNDGDDDDDNKDDDGSSHGNNGEIMIVMIVRVCIVLLMIITLFPFIYEVDQVKGE